ncbi:MAG: DUF4296 domain-containing protein [Bacteroidales bacterium]
MTPSRKIYILVMALMVPVAGCINREKVPKPDNMIPHEDLVSILTEMYIADGLLTNPVIRSVYENKDSIENYMDIYADHGYTTEDMDASLSYLFTGNPKKLEAVYDRVLANLSRMEADNLKEREIDSTNDIDRNYYTGKISIALPDQGITNKIEVDIPIDRPGSYVFKSRIVLYEDDQTIDPFVNLWYWYDDGTEEGHIEHWDTLWLKKTGRANLMTVTGVMTDSSATNIRGFLFDHTDQPGHWEKHALFSSISFTRVPDDSSLADRKVDER